MCHLSDHQDAQYKFFFNYTIPGNTLERVDDHEHLGISMIHMIFVGKSIAIRLLKMQVKLLDCYVALYFNVLMK